MFTLIYAKESVKNVKPDPEVHYKILEELNVKKEECIIIEDFTVAGKSVDAFLDPCSAGIIDADHRTAALDGQLNGVCDFKAVLLAQCPADHGKVLGIYYDLLAAYGSVAGDNTIVGKLPLPNIESILQVGDIGTNFPE